QFFEHAPAVLVVFELVEAGAGGGEEDDVAGSGRFGSLFDCHLEGTGTQDVGGARDLRFDFFGGGADGVHALGALAEQRREHGVVAALVLAAEDHVQIGGERFQGFDGGVNVGGLGVVVVIHAGDGGDVLQPVLDRLEFPDRAANAAGLAGDDHADAGGGQHVFQIVRAFQRDFVNRQDGGLAAVVAMDDLAVAHERTLLHFFSAAEPAELRANALGHAGAVGVIGV